VTKLQKNNGALQELSMQIWGGPWLNVALRPEGVSKPNLFSALSPRCTYGLYLRLSLLISGEFPLIYGLASTAKSTRSIFPAMLETTNENGRLPPG
jgi:hypothetical protein